MNTPAIRGKAARLRSLRPIVRVKPFIEIPVEAVNSIIALQGLTSEVRERTDALRRDIAYAVRSAAIGEDSSDHAWAGQFTTVLDVRHERFEEAILTCCKALHGETVKAYSAAHSVSVAGLELMVQEMVDADCAGVLFTTNPVGSEGHMVIEAIRGNAEKLVGGTAEPSRYYLDPITGEVVREEIANDFCLSAMQLRELFDTAILVRSHFGEEQDIEWAFERGTGDLYINQSRDITTLENVLDDAAIASGVLNVHLLNERQRLTKLGCDLEPDVLSNQNIAELLTSSPTRMAYGLFCYLFAHGEGAIKTGRNEMGYEIGDELNAGFQLLVAGKPMMSVAHDAFTYRVCGIPLSDYCRIVNGYLARIRSDETLANYPEVGLYDQDPSLEYLVRLFGESTGRRYRSAYDSFFERIRALEDAMAGKAVSDFEHEWEATIRSFKDSMPQTLEESVGRYKEMCDLLRTGPCRLFVKVARLGFFAYARARSTLIQQYGEKAGEYYLNALTTGVQAIRSPNHQFTHELFRLRIGSTNVESVAQQFGHLAEHELEIAMPRYREQPGLLVLLASKIDTSRPNTDGAGDRDELQETLRSEMGTRWEKLRRDLRIARGFLLDREVVKFNYLKGYEILRSLAVSIERMLGWERDLIFHLDPTQVFRLPHAADELHDIAILARNQRTEHRPTNVPAVLFTDRLNEIGRPVQTGDRILRGIGVTNQICEGDCVVVNCLTDLVALSQLKPGSVLVTENTDPAWAPVIATVGKRGGLITEVGGMLAHTAICARELGTAAVLNIPNVTRILKTGMRVRVDGPRGLVEIL
jgi:phosphohistidine swiveling domain-containing protein